MSRKFYATCTKYEYPQPQQQQQQQQQQQHDVNNVVTESSDSHELMIDDKPSSPSLVVMDCTGMRPGPFNYLMSEQAKSLVALQELQNEVGALLEFRDLVIETFPKLRQKMSSTSIPTDSVPLAVSSSSQISSTNIPIGLSMSPLSRRTSDWEPGKVRRRVATRDRDRDNAETSSTSLPRSRSNSQSCGNNSNYKNSGTVQDSGFSTETSSKDSASTAIPRPSSPKPLIDEAEDELWNLLDVIHRKGIKLREEVESLQEKLENIEPDDEERDNNDDDEKLNNSDVFEAVKNLTDNNDTKIHGNRDNDDRLGILGHEKNCLIDKVAILEAETLKGRNRTRELENELGKLSTIRNTLEEQLRLALDTKHIDDHDIQTITSKTHNKNRFRTRTIDKNVLANGAVQNIVRDYNETTILHNEKINRLGTLDDVLIDPNTIYNVKGIDRHKIYAILREQSSLELQRHLITSTVHNQCLQKTLEKVEKSTGTLSERLDKAKEENDDLRFQLEERNIELEGTRARVRILERLHQRRPTEEDPSMNPGEVPELVRSDVTVGDPGSSTESSRDHTNNIRTSSPRNRLNSSADNDADNPMTEIKASPRRRPSRIPLLGLPPTSSSPGSTSSSGCALKTMAPKPPQSISKIDNPAISLKSLTTKRETISINSTQTKNPVTKNSGRDSSRESLNSRSSLTKINNSIGKQETNKESLNRSLPRNNNNVVKNSTTINNTTNNNSFNNSPGCTQATSSRRPIAPARRSQSLARNSVDNSDNGKILTSDPPTSWCSSSSTSSLFHNHSDSSLYPDSLNQETTSPTVSTRVEFLIGSPTRRFRNNAGWPVKYLDSINSTNHQITPESLKTDEFPLRCGEALAECDSLDCHQISSEN